METSKAVKKILLVDDDVDDRKYFKEALYALDPAVKFDEAKDGQQALDHLRNASSSLPDYIFLDLRMPRHNGRQCLRQIKADERLQHIPVIIYTTSEEADDSKEMQALGAVRFVSKPSNTDEIYYMISLVLKG